MHLEIYTLLSRAVSHIQCPMPANEYYTGNLPPLAPSPYIRMPVGSVKPRGWLRRQMELQADGFTGHLPELSVFLRKENNAWLKPDGVGENGGEEVPYWLRGFCTLGYLLGDGRIISEAQAWINAVVAGQKTDGFFGPEILRTAANGYPYILNHFYMVHALQSYHEYSNDRRIVDFLLRFYQWQTGIPERDFISDGWQHARGVDNLVGIYWLYNRTGESWLLDLASKTHRCTKPIPGETHNVNFAECFHEPTVYWMQAGTHEDRDSAERAYSAIRAAYGQVPGGMFGADEQTRGGFFGPRQGIEGCGMVEMMRSCEMLLCILGESKWADRCEDVAFNSYPASMTADYRALRYQTAPNLVISNRGSKVPDFYNVGTQLAMDPHGGPLGLWEEAPTGYRCCLHNTGHGWTGLTQHLWLATPDNGIAAAMYSPCEVTAKVGSGTDITIIEETRYPFREKVELRIALSRPDTFPMYLRIPGWCEQAKITVNGEPCSEFGDAGISDPEAGSFYRLRRTWLDGDRVQLTFPMPVWTTQWEKNKNCVSVNRGPLSFSLKIQEEYVRCGGTEKWPSFEIFPKTKWNYGLTLKNEGAERNFELIERSWPADNQPFTVEGSPIALKTGAAAIPHWKADRLDIVGPVPHSPVRRPASDGDAPETVELIPMGAARLRISAFPVIEAGGGNCGAGVQAGDGPNATTTAFDAQVRCAYTAETNEAESRDVWDWAIGPFIKTAEPVLCPSGRSSFTCPVRGEKVAWEGLNVYNPAAVVKDGKVFMLYRADDLPWWKNKDGADWRTSRIGLAVSDDGRHFRRHPEPVLFPDEDKYRQYEWPGGCEDIHIVEDEQGVFYLYYTTWTGECDTMSVATSNDLLHWEKHGPVFENLSPGKMFGSRSGVVVCEINAGKLAPAKINGKYYMYYTHPSILAESENLIDWKVTGKEVWKGRHESGAVALLRDDGVLLMFNGQNWGDLPFASGTWTLGQALIDRNDMVSVLKHQKRPFLYPELPWEYGDERYRTMVVPAMPSPDGGGNQEHQPNVTLAVVSNTLIQFRGEWLLYYGAADRYIGLATCPIM